MKKQLSLFYSAMLFTALIFTGLHAAEGHTQKSSSSHDGSSSGSSSCDYFSSDSPSRDSPSSDNFLSAQSLSSPSSGCYDCNPLITLNRTTSTMLDVKIERLNMALQMSMVTNPVRFGATNTAGLTFMCCVENATCKGRHDQIKIIVDFAADYDWSKNTITDATNLEVIEDLYNYIVKLVHRHVDESIKEESIVVEMRQLQPHGIPPNSLVTWQNGYAYYEEVFYQIMRL